MPTPANDPGDPPVRISDDDLRRYVGGSLAPARRRAVEGFLACNPDLAARVMAELHRCAGPSTSRRRSRTLAAAGLAIALGACSASAFAGWTVAEQRDLEGWREADGDMPPEYVEEAAESRQATATRAAMASQPETPRLDVAEIRRALRIDIPRLPSGWRLLDVQVYPTDEGPGLNLSAQAPDGRRFTLFIVRADTGSNDRPELARRGADLAAFWERGDAAYVLSGDAPGDVLLSEAQALSRVTTS